MKIFISWSGERSKYIAALLRDWLKSVLQASKPWMSDSDINKGSIWFNDVSGELKDVAVGIVCLTPENKDKPWILFEAGALLRGLTNSCVCTILIDLDPADVESTLSHFNHTKLDKDGLLALLGTLNDQLGESRLEKETLKSSFDAFWPKLEKGLQTIPKIKGPKTGKRDSGEILEEILEISRELLTQQSIIRNTAVHVYPNTGSSLPSSNIFLSPSLANTIATLSGTPYPSGGTIYSGVANPGPNVVTLLGGGVSAVGQAAPLQNSPTKKDTDK